jgi:uncharacterized membrane protein YdjX (TVP38/TMEM64 family)
MKRNDKETPEIINDRLLWRAAFLGGLLVIILLGGLLFFAKLTSGFDLSGKAVAEYVIALGPWGYAAVIGLMVIHSFIPFPAEVIAIAAGMCYGIVLGTVLTWVGAMLGAAMSFGLARAFGRPFVDLLLAKKHFDRLEHLAETQGTSALLISRFIPVIAFNLINYAAGLTRVSWVTFIWTTGFGILPLTVLMVIMGDQMRDPYWSEWVLYGVAGLGMLAIVWWLNRRARAL